MNIRFLLNEEKTPLLNEENLQPESKRAKVVKVTPVELREMQSTQMILGELLSVPVLFNAKPQCISLQAAATPALPLQASSVFNKVVEGTGEDYDEKNPIHKLLGYEEIHDGTFDKRLYTANKNNFKIEYVAGSTELYDDRNVAHQGKKKEIKFMSAYALKKAKNKITAQSQCIPLQESDVIVVHGTCEVYNEKNPIHKLLGPDPISKYNLKKRRSEARTHVKDNNFTIELLAGRTELYDDSNVAHKAQAKKTYVFTSKLARDRAEKKISRMPASSTDESAEFAQSISGSTITNISTTPTTSTVSSNGLFNLWHATQGLEEEVNAENAKTFGSASSKEF